MLSVGSPVKVRYHVSEMPWPRQVSGSSSDPWVTHLQCISYTAYATNIEQANPVCSEPEVAGTRCVALVFQGVHNTILVVLYLINTS